MRLTELLGERLEGTGRAPEDDREISGLSANSRDVEPGFLFAALPGTRRDGRAFAGEAVARGAIAVLIDEEGAASLPASVGESAAIVLDRNPRRCFARMAARFYIRQPTTIAAVTGTNGKTSVVHFTREIWSRLGHKAASVGTLGLVTPQGRRPGSLTTPDPVVLHRDLAELAEADIDHLAIEASSHGLQQHRLDGLEIAAAGFTNLSRDHLDYHRDMSSYRAAKQRLFRELLCAGGTAVLNADSEEFAPLAEICAERGLDVIAYGAAPATALRLLDCKPTSDGQSLSLEIFGARRELRLPLVGRFQAMNALCALGLAIATGSPADAASMALQSLSGVPGRMQLVAQGEGGGGIIVDYAHTPDALATVLSALRPHAKARLVALFGAGGDRDPGKRPLMGAVAASLADAVYVTDDNPRSEPPAEIRRAILSGAPGAVEIGDRREAIAAAIASLGSGDFLVVAGKGHETGQIVGDEVRPFDDAAVVREILGR